MKTALRYLIPFFAAIFCLGAVAAFAQEDEPADVRKYREDYEAYQKIAAVSDPMKRGEQLIQFVKERPNSKLAGTAQGNVLSILDGYIKSENSEALLSLSDKLVKARPKVGEAYYCQGLALKNLKRLDEAMDALAKCYVLKNPVSTKAKALLDMIYKGQHRGLLDGQEAIIAKARQDIAKFQ
jgi:tetratricopeptide (TPR) repeat protein